MNKDLPPIETPEVAKAKLKQSYLSFIDSCSKFITMANYFAQEENKGHGLPATFSEDYTKNLSKLRDCTLDDFVYFMASPCALHLGFIDECKENLESYYEILKGQDESLSDYDKACDLLAIKDTFTDLENSLNETNKIILSERDVETHVDNKHYDLQKAQALKINPEQE